MPVFDVQNGQRYRVEIRCSPLERLLVNQRVLVDLLAQSGLTGVTYQTNRDGFIVDGVYTGESGRASLPDRVTSLVVVP